jgi:hypothetical protein
MHPPDVVQHTQALRQQMSMSIPTRTARMVPMMSPLDAKNLARATLPRWETMTKAMTMTAGLPVPLSSQLSQFSDVHGEGHQLMPQTKRMMLLLSYSPSCVVFLFLLCLVYNLPCIKIKLYAHSCI